MQSDLDHFIREYEGSDWTGLAHEVNKRFGTTHNRKSIRNKYIRLQEATMRKAKKPPISEAIKQEREARSRKVEEHDLKSKYEHALRLLEKTEAERDVVKEIREVSTFTIKPTKATKSEATAVIVASDWHIEENVDENAVNGLNKFNLAIAEKRATQFFQNALTLIRKEQEDVEVRTIVLALLGDFISGSIHEDIAENNNLGPADALIFVERLIASGIEFLLANSTLNLVIPCHSGNHGRMTKEQRFATENANSLEYYMYHALATYFKNEPRVKFVLSPAYHSYVDIYGYTIRFHHGHNLRYGGGVGGIYIPANKAIAQWNKAKRADLDVFGHFHQLRDGGNFICNGSLIGFNSYAVGIKADFEKPKQAFFLIDKLRGKTITCPILFDI